MNRCRQIVLLMLIGLLVGATAQAAKPENQKGYYECVLAHIDKAQSTEAIETLKEACRELQLDAGTGKAEPSQTQPQTQSQEQPAATRSSQPERVVAERKVPDSVVADIQVSGFHFGSDALELTLTNDNRNWTLARYSLIFIKESGANVTGERFSRVEGPAMKGAVGQTEGASGVRFSLSERLPPMASKTVYLDLSQRDLRSSDSYRWQLFDVHGFRR